MKNANALHGHDACLLIVHVLIFIIGRGHCWEWRFHREPTWSVSLQYHVTSTATPNSSGPGKFVAFTCCRIFACFVCVGVSRSYALDFSNDAVRFTVSQCDMWPVGKPSPVQEMIHAEMYTDDSQFALVDAVVPSSTQAILPSECNTPADDTAQSLPPMPRGVTHANAHTEASVTRGAVNQQLLRASQGASCENNRMLFCVISVLLAVCLGLLYSCSLVDVLLLYSLGFCACMRRWLSFASLRVLNDRQYGSSSQASIRTRRTR